MLKSADPDSDARSGRGEEYAMAVGALSSFRAGIHSAGVELERSSRRITRLLPEALERLDPQPQNAAGTANAQPPPASPNPEPELNLAREFVRQDLALLQARASIRVAETELDLLGSLIDLKA
jgi:hypothetical protein